MQATCFIFGGIEGHEYVYEISGTRIQCIHKLVQSLQSKPHQSLDLFSINYSPFDYFVPNKKTCGEI
jgi:hypothetical protein